MSDSKRSTIGDGMRLGCGCFLFAVLAAFVVFVVLPLFGIVLIAAAGK